MFNTNLGYTVKALSTDRSTELSVVHTLKSNAMDLPKNP